MPRINLKNILVKNNEANALLSSLMKELNANVYIEDDAQKILFGKYSDTILHKQSITLDEDIIGWVKGDEKVSLITSFINLLIQKEVEKKKIGSEVLMLYQELNLIFNFSEKLAQNNWPEFHCRNHA